MPYNLSFWEHNAFFEGLDAAIIGSGIVGLSAALRLRKLRPKWTIAILERGALPAGASTRNAGFACFGSMTELMEDLEDHSPEEVFGLVKQRWRGLQKLRACIGDKNMNYQPSGNYELFTAAQEAEFQKCREQLPWFNDQMSKITGAKATYQIDDHRISDFGFAGVRHLIVNTGEGQIDTGKMMRQLLVLARQERINIFTGIAVQHIEDDAENVTITTKQNWKIHARKVIVATNGFVRQLFPEMTVQAARNQVLITHPVEQLKAKGCFHFDRGYFYFRNVGERILIGGGRHLFPETEYTDVLDLTGEVQQSLENMLREVVLPQTDFTVQSRWSGILGIGEKKKPIVKKISENVAVAVRLGGMGVAIGSLTGEKGAALLLK